MRRMIKLLLGSLVVCGLAVLAINRSVNTTGVPLIRSVGDLRPAQVALIFGAYAYPDGTPCYALEDRLNTGLELYEKGIVDKLIVSGDHGSKDYDEVNAMRRYLEAAGVPKDDLFCDHAGFDTYDSLYRARDIFGVQTLVLVTQEFHLPRALYIGESLGLDCEGVVADKRVLPEIRSLEAREVGAKVKAFWDVQSQRFPVFLGPQIALSESAVVTHDS